MKINIFLAFFLICSCQNITIHTERAVAGKFGSKAEREYFLNTPQSERADILSRAKVFLPQDSSSQNPQVSVIEDYLKKYCDSEFQYFDGQNYHWPEKTCSYKPDTEKKIGGGSPKFLCDFKNSEAKDSVQTVKYTFPFLGFYGGEVHEVLLATNLAKLMGFPVTYYCPVHVTCKDCPSSNPWLNHHGQDAAKAGNTVHFKYAMIVKKIDAAIVSESTGRNSPNGLVWDELKNIKAGAEKRQSQIEREAWMLWIHFIQITDAHAQNSHLVCKKIVETAQKKFECEESYIYSHDYGYAFNNANIDEWGKYPTLKKNKSNQCEGIVGKSWGSVKSRDAMQGLVLNANISEEAKQLFLERLLKITDQQWKESYMISKMNERSVNTANDFLNTVKNKISELQNIKCSSIEEGKSVLSNE